MSLTIDSQKIYESLSSMKSINSASDNAAGMAIAEGMKSQSSGYAAGTNNAEAAKNLNQTAEGGLSSMKDSLQRIRELSVQASNGIYTSSDKQAIQYEIDQLKLTIQDAAKNTEFNTKKLLDGSSADINTATNPNGTGSKIQLVNSTLEELGIADYDVTGKFDISKIDDALSKVTSSMSKLGASSNALDHTISYNNIAQENMDNSRSKIEDLDVGKAISDLKKEEVLQEYKYFAQSARQQQDRSIVDALLH